MAFGLPIWFALMLGLTGALGLAALARPKAVWAVLSAFVAGNAGQLGLTDPLWFGSLQLKPHGIAPLCYALIAYEAAVAGVLLLRHQRLKRLIAGAQTLGSGRSVLLLLLLLCSAVSPMGFLLRHEYVPFAKQVVANAGLLLIHAAALSALAMALPYSVFAGLGARIDTLLRWRHLPRAAALWVFAVSLTLGLTAFDRMPRLPDEVSYLFQAKMYAGGYLFMPAPGGAMDAALAYDWISIEGGKWFSIFPPGWPAVLALGVAAGVPFLVNPLLAALGVVLSHSFVSRIASSRLAAMVTLLLCVSPWYLATGASLMSHPLTLVLVLGAWLLLLKDDGAWLLCWFGAGLLMGVLFLTRPLEGVFVGFATGLWALSRADLKSLSGWISVAVYGLGCIVIGAMVFPYNQMLTGNALSTPIDQYFDLLWHKGANRLGFGADIGSPDSWGGVDIWRGHSPLEALIEGQFNLKSMNVELLGWVTGSLALLYVHLLWGKKTRADWAMYALIALTIGTYGLYWFNGGFYIGPRYWFMTLWPALFLSARGLQTAAAKLSGIGAEEARQRIALPAIVMGTLALVAFLPWRASEKYSNFRSFHDDYRTLAASGAVENALVFVKTDEVGDWGSAFMLNSPTLDGTIFLRDLGPAANAAIIARYPGHAVHYVTGRSQPTEKKETP